MLIGNDDIYAEVDGDEIQSCTEKNFRVSLRNKTKEALLVINSC